MVVLDRIAKKINSNERTVQRNREESPEPVCYGGAKIENGSSTTPAQRLFEGHELWDSIFQQKSVIASSAPTIPRTSRNGVIIVAQVVDPEYTNFASIA